MLRDISVDLHDTGYLTVMADEITESSNQEQATLIPYLVTQNLAVHKKVLVPLSSSHSGPHTRGGGGGV